MSMVWTSCIQCKQDGPGAVQVKKKDKKKIRFSNTSEKQEMIQRNTARLSAMPSNAMIALGLHVISCTVIRSDECLPSTVPISKKPRIGLRFSLLKIGITALVTTSMIRVSSLAPAVEITNMSGERGGEGVEGTTEDIIIRLVLHIMPSS